MRTKALPLALLPLLSCKNEINITPTTETAACTVRKRTIAEENAAKFILKYQQNDSFDAFTVHTENDKVVTDSFLPHLQRGHTTILKMPQTPLLVGRVATSKSPKISQITKPLSVHNSNVDLMLVLDRILASHPLHKLSNWVSLARNFGDTDGKKYSMKAMPKD